MNDLSKVQLKISKFCKWLVQETKDSVNFEINFWEHSFKTSDPYFMITLWSSKYNHHCCFATLEDFLKTIDIFENNIELFFNLPGDTKTFDEYLKATNQHDEYFQRALDCYQVSKSSFDSLSLSLQEQIKSLAHNLRMFEV